MKRTRENRAAGAGARSRRAGGYSLVELMAALGILALALPMIGTAILTGMIENQESVQDTMAMIVAENALAVVRTRVSHEDLMRAPAAGGWGTGQTALAPIPSHLVQHEELAWQPFELADDPKKSPYWCVVAGQRLTADKNDYRLIAIPYRKFDETAAVEKVEVELEGTKVTKYEVFLEGADESVAIGFLVVRTALRPETYKAPAAIGGP